MIATHHMKPARHESRTSRRRNLLPNSWTVLALVSALLWITAQGVTKGGQPPTPTVTPAAASVTMPRRTQGDIEHGRYLVERVVMCVECHSSRDEQGEIIPESRFMGGAIPFRPPWPNDWAIAAPRNAGLPGYTDELAIRLLTQGAIDRHGRQLRPPMPRFRMTREDAADVIAYMRSLK